MVAIDTSKAFDLVNHMTAQSLPLDIMSLTCAVQHSEPISAKNPQLIEKSLPQRHYSLCEPKKCDDGTLQHTSAHLQKPEYPGSYVSSNVYFQPTDKGHEEPSTSEKTTCRKPSPEEFGVRIRQSESIERRYKTSLSERSRVPRTFIQYQLWPGLCECLFPAGLIDSVCSVNRTFDRLACWYQPAWPTLPRPADYIRTI